jgi:hypothetical protein
MMGYCCADGKVGMRTELEAHERFSQLPPTTNMNSDGGSSSSSSGGGGGGGTASAVDSCVEHFMTANNKWTEDMFVQVE